LNQKILLEIPSLQMKTKFTIFAVALAVAVSADAQSVLLAGFDGNQTENNAVSPKTLTGPLQHSSAVGNVEISLSTSSTLVNNVLDWAAGFQGSSILWGTTDLDPDASTANNNAVYAHDALATIQMTVTNTGTSDVSLAQLHMRVKRDNATTSATGIRVTYVSGDLTDTAGSNALIALNAAASTVGYDFALSNLISDIILAAGESATFTWASEGGTGGRTRFDNIALTGTVSGGPDIAAPTPDPMTWANPPAAAGDSSITMTATVAADPSGVQYEFTRYAADGTTLLFTSPWQNSPSYTDTDLTPDTTYSYTVRARDLSANNNTTAPSTPAASATTDPADTAAPTPDPMTWANVPEAVNDNSITMTATTATDPSGVKYQFTRYAADGTTLLFTSPWQDSPEFTDTGLDPETTYTYTVKARDNSLGQYETDVSDPPLPATTPAVPVGPVLLGGFDGNNAVNAPKQHSSATGNFSMALSATTTLAGGLNPGALMQSASILWGTTDLDPDADNSNNNAVLIADVALELVITVTNTSVSSDVSLDTLHWISKRDGSNSPTTATITYTSGSLNQALGTNASASLGAVGTTGHDFDLSGMLSDRVLAPGETATFTFVTTVGETNQRLRMDNIAMSGAFSPSDYYFWVLEQGWTYGALGTGGNDDYDKDGLTNDMERMFALDPNSASSSNPYVTPFDPATGTLSYSRRTQSMTGLNYPVWFSTDLEGWFRDIYANETPGTPANDVEIVGVQINPVLLSEPRLFIQLRPEPPVVLPAPELINMVGSVNTITINFTQELYQLTATDPASYTVQLNGGGTVTVTDASLSESGKTVTLTLGSTLSLASAYNVSFSNLTGTTGVSLAGSGTGQFETWDNDPAGVKVFILAGQSNMVGYGHSEVGNGGVAGAIGSLRYLAVNNATYPEYDYTSLLQTPGDPANSPWASLGNIKFWGRNGTSGSLGGNILKGDLGPIYGATNATPPDTWFGPEYAFGHVISQLYASDNVLIIKAAWGGHSLGGDFRPPSAVADRGGEVGASYLEVFKNAHEVLDNLGTVFPEWAGKGYQIVGFGWHQGVSDKGEPFATEYKENLPDLIGDVRAELGKPDLPFVIATTGMDNVGPVGPYEGYTTVEKAQLWVAGVAQPANVLTSDTRSFWRDASVSPRDQGYHWNHNAESYFLVGKAMGDDMVDLLTP
jgi:alpha-galactosidase